MDDKTIAQWSAGPRCTVAEAAELLGTSTQTVRRMVRLGQLIAVFLPAPRRYVRVDDDGNLPVWMHKSDYQELHNGPALASGVRGEYEGDDK